jgi:hypothetical protein
MSKEDKMAAIKDQRFSSTNCKMLLGHADWSESELRTIQQSSDQNAQNYFHKLAEIRSFKTKNLLDKAFMNMDCQSELSQFILCLVTN